MGREEPAAPAAARSVPDTDGENDMDDWYGEAIGGVLDGSQFEGCGIHCRVCFGRVVVVQ